MALSDQLLLDTLEPTARLSAGRRQELAALCFLEKVTQNIDPLRMNVSKSAQAIYLVKGDLGIRFVNQSKVILRGGSPAAKHPLNQDAKIKDTIALTDIEILRIDMDLLDIMMTWDQLSQGEMRQQRTASEDHHARTTADWMHDTSVFSVEKLQKGVFSRLPAANIEAMFKRMTRITTTAGQTIIQQGMEGDYYYLIERGTVIVSKVHDFTRPPEVVAELEAGNAFGEEALASDNKRSATVTMKTDGELLRLNKTDFVELLKAPLITQVKWLDAERMVAEGAVWVDVRLPSEYTFDHIRGAINLPVGDIRQHADTLDKTKTYLVYCQTGRRSSAAAFILAQRGFDVLVLAGGTRARG
ncbi:MAG: cyclic nucleotide-binding domain-containing protein [Methylotenera sp.]|nr:cyclic nucleotide-binding domain-containing protein [Methylotenera sp.]